MGVANWISAQIRVSDPGARLLTALYAGELRLSARSGIKQASQFSIAQQPRPKVTEIYADSSEKALPGPPESETE